MGLAPKVLQGWEPEQVDQLIAILEFEANIGSHGHPVAEATSDAADPTNYTGGFHYEGKGPFWDWAAKARLDADDAYRAQFPKDAPPNMNGAYYVVEKVVDEAPGYRSSS